MWILNHLGQILSPLDATLTRNRGRGVVLVWLTRNPAKDSCPEESAVADNEGTFLPQVMEHGSRDRACPYFPALSFGTN